MDFLFTPEQDEAAELAAQILADQTTNERLKEVEAGGDRFDRALWKDLDEAGLLSLHLPEDQGGAGLGLVELARVLVEVGKRVAPVPLAVHGACTALLAAHGVTVGDRLYAAAVAEERAHLPAAPVVTVAADGTLTGVKTLVRAGMAADALLVTATGPAGVGVHLVDAAAPGVERVAQRTSDGDTAALITFCGAAATQVGGADAAERLGQLLVALSAAEQVGVTEGALRLTAEYAKTREQFGRPIGTFQAVSQRLADGFIDVLGQRLTLWQAVWRLQEGLPAATEVATAKLWAADAGHRIAHTTVHVHGGVGIDLDGEAHRYFTSGKRFEFLFGGATEQALAIGRSFA
ncbi:acyl-CoA/acyl-ACP dehydrogenase [Nocardioides carbamazepini]|uniref:acyl-CoA dehydrogenase family protein n=1 Tax=Nocardioides carbamazepini TaxID=2854259 RepID=UPI00214A80B0|nr:acyl-CoA dehydrogenase family protein [Nocardioides carbamazepini]MCR1782967.1 acyl-CoA/acyl-ACP dehydrogenase [Nocardioides carbamazepini]